jgi:ribosomal protein S17
VVLVVLAVLMNGGPQVVSNRMQRTVVVAVSYVVWVPKYKVYERRVSRHMVRVHGRKEVWQSDTEAYSPLF